MSSDKVGDLANQAFVSLDENALVAEAAKALYEMEDRSVIVTGNDAASQARIPVGIITGRDIIFRVVAQNRGPFKVKLRDIMPSADNHLGWHVCVQGLVHDEEEECQQTAGG